MYTVDVRVLGNGQYKLLDDVFFKTDKYRITVSKGFVYDGASIPKNLWDDVGCPMDYAFASAVHDGLYRSRLLERKECDKIFHRALIDTGINQVTAKAMYLAVRAMGDKPYDEAVHMMAHYRNYVTVSPRI